MDILRSLCCCKTGDEDDESYLVRNEDDEDVYRSESLTVPSNVSGSNGIPAGNRLSPPLAGSDPTRSREQEEAALINRILHTAQERIIDVNLDDNVGEVDISQRTRAYAEAIRKHDSKRKCNGEESAPLGHLLSDSGAQAQSVLLQSAVSAPDLSLLMDASGLLTEAVRTDVGIHPNEQLVVYMDQLDS